MRNTMIVLLGLGSMLAGLAGCFPNDPKEGDDVSAARSAASQKSGAEQSNSQKAASQQAPGANALSASQCWDLAQGPKNNDYGDVCIANDADNIYVTYTADASCPLTEVHVCVDTSDFPWTPPGQCAYNAEFNDNPQTSYTVTIPLSDFPEAVCGETDFFVQAHAALACGESAYAGTFKGNVEYTLQCVDDGGCTRTQGYWKNHASDWSSVDLALGGVIYSHADAMAILQTPSNGDASLILAHQLIAAKLNILVNSASDGAVSSAIADADAWLAANADADGSLPFGVSPASAEGAEATALATTLDQYNNGLIGPGHCEK
ncbi:MAG: hypothetical protein HUU21_03780 [Polyangiaceae bacterium]|nr:hypothetical protein [Polyangiaceae bacterium]